jgi:chromosome segregation ATPase
LYELARRVGQDGVREHIASIVSQFVSFEQLQRPLIAAFEDIAKTALKYSEVEQEATSLRAVIGERDGDLAAANARAVDAERRLAETLLAIDQQRAQIAELAKERDEASGLQAVLAERAATLAQEREVAQAEVAILREALARAEQERAAAAEAMQSEIETLRAGLARHEDTASVRAMQKELAALRSVVAQADRDGQVNVDRTHRLRGEIRVLREAVVRAEGEAQQRTSAAAASRAEVQALRETLARAESAAKERAAVAAASQAEIRGLRETLMQAERERQQRATDAAALRDQIAALHRTLAAARQVGKAAIAAFRIEAAAPTEPLARRRWPAITRFFGIRRSF